MVAMLVPVIVEVIAGLVAVWVAIRAWGGHLPRDGTVGIRTPSTMRSDAAFETANKAAAPFAGAGGTVMAVCAVLAAVFPRHFAGVFIFGGVGALLVLFLLGTAIGVRASRSVRLVTTVTRRPSGIGRKKAAVAEACKSRYR
jgi:uncharacterized membrane protein